MWLKAQKLRAKSLDDFITDLSDLLAAGIDLDQSLSALLAIAPKRYQLAKSMQSQIRRGVAVDEVFSNAPFPEVVVAFARIGFATGELAQSLQNLSAHLASRRKHREKWIKMTAYPLFLLLLTTASLYLLAWQVIPQFARFYQAMNLQMPLALTWWLQGADAMAVLLPGLLVLIASFALILWWTRKRWLISVERWLVGRKWGGWLRMVKAGQTFATLSALLSAGIDLVSSLQVLIATDTARMKHEWTEILRAIEKGEPFSSAVKLSPYFPDLTIAMLAISEQTGDLEGGATRLKSYYERAITRELERFFAIFEPASLIFLGLVVGSVTIEVLWPMTDLVKQLS